MTETTSPARRPGYHVLLYTVGAFLAAGALICLVLVFAAPEIRGMQGLAVAGVGLASAIIGATAIHRKVDQIGRDLVAPDLARRVDELTRDFAQSQVAQLHHQRPRR